MRVERVGVDRVRARLEHHAELQRKRKEPDEPEFGTKTSLLLTADYDAYMLQKALEEEKFKEESKAKKRRLKEEARYVVIAEP